MSTNLRLSDEAAASLRAEAERTGRSQQDILREAVDRHLGRLPARSSEDADPLVAAGKVLPPRAAYRDVNPAWRLAPGEDSVDLLDRDDRI